MSRAMILPRGIDDPDVFFDSMPNEFRSYLKDAFSMLAKRPGSSLSEIASQVSGWLDPAESEPEVDALATTLNVSEQESTAIIAVSTLVASACFAISCPMSIGTFVSKATGYGLLADFVLRKLQKLSEQLSRTKNATIQLPA